MCSGNPGHYFLAFCKSNISIWIFFFCCICLYAVRLFPFLKVSSYPSSFLSKTIDVHVCFIAMYRKINLLRPCWELENSNFCLEQNWGSCSVQFSLHLHVVWLPWLGFHENICNFFSIFTAAPISLTSDCDDFESHDAYSSLNYPRNYKGEWKITVSSGMVRIGYRLSEHMGKVIGWH